MTGHDVRFTSPGRDAPPKGPKMKNLLTADTVITVQVARLIVQGMDPVAALKEVCGADKVDAMISDLYDELRAA